MSDPSRVAEGLLRVLAPGGPNPGNPADAASPDNNLAADAKAIAVTAQLVSNPDVTLAVDSVDLNIGGGFGVEIPTGRRASPVLISPTRRIKLQQEYGSITFHPVDGICGIDRYSDDGTDTRLIRRIGDGSEATVIRTTAGTYQIPGPPPQRSVPMAIPAKLPVRCLRYVSGMLHVLVDVPTGPGVWLSWQAPGYMTADIQWWWPGSGQPEGTHAGFWDLHEWGGSVPASEKVQISPPPADKETVFPRYPDIADGAGGFYTRYKTFDGLVPMRGYPHVPSQAIFDDGAGAFVHLYLSRDGSELRRWAEANGVAGQPVYGGKTVTLPREGYVGLCVDQQNSPDENSPDALLAVERGGMVTGYDVSDWTDFADDPRTTETGIAFLSGGQHRDICSARIDGIGWTVITLAGRDLLFYSAETNVAHGCYVGVETTAPALAGVIPVSVQAVDFWGDPAGAGHSVELLVTERRGLLYHDPSADGEALKKIAGSTDANGVFTAYLKGSTLGAETLIGRLT